MYGLPDTLRPLSAAEEQVMLAVWACPGAAARRDISQKLKATGWAAATVLNFLYRLEEKGWVRSAKQLQRVCAAGHPAGLRRVLYAAAAGYPV